MAPAKRYKVLVGTEVIFSGPWRTAKIVYAAVLQTAKIVCPVGSIPLTITLAFDL